MTAPWTMSCQPAKTGEKSNSMMMIRAAYLAAVPNHFWVSLA
jgi:hypothetical protein